ncbi:MULTISPECIES: hypothetical protein [unclassified Lysobacter]|uniref:hypothetical protein n=1 Tax=unclassified Lysobacter TaxID=2635362 RepID=UPI001C2468F5|nr:hypothetical protein [Lysobacter sp. MMG2]MBU8978005.1 hypothetical protein [Lysobacter sp. MMG2]
MDAPRYFVTYRRPENGETATRVLGRFHDRAAAERVAREHLRVAGLEMLAIRAETPLEALHYRFSRIMTRTLRITLGAGLSLLAYHELFRTGSRMGDLPLSRLTLNMLLTFGFHGVLMIAAVVFCWDIAFGEGPHHGR